MFSAHIYTPPSDGWWGHIAGRGEERALETGEPQANNWIMFIDNDGACFFYRRNADGSVIEESNLVFDPRRCLEVSKPGPIPDVPA